MTIRNGYLLGGGLAALAAAVIAINGCTADSVEGGARQVGLIVEGFYAHPDAFSRMVQRTSGADVTSLNLRQSGDQLEAFDNNGVFFTGTIGRVSDTNLATFTISGQSTVGQPATIAGTIAVEGSDATMRGSWIEPTLVSEVFAMATVPTNAPPPVPETNDVVRLNQTQVTINGAGGATTFTASGGTGNFTWRVSNSSLGNFTALSGARNSSATYTASGVGNNTVTVTDAAGESATAIVQQTSSANAVTLNRTLVTLSPVDGTADFTASGGTGNFSWSVSNTDVGRIVSISGSRNADATYTVVSGATGQNTLTVRDAEGTSASATIIQTVLGENGGVLPPPPQ
jgi:hypothetical protein